MTTAARHFQLFREVLPRRQLNRRWLHQRAHQLNSGYISESHNSSTAWVAFAASPGIDVAVLVRSFCAVHRHFIYLEAIDNSLNRSGYGCVVWRDDQLVLAGEYNLTELRAQLIDMEAQLTDAYWLVSASVENLCWALPMMPATAEKLTGYEFGRKALAAAKMRPLKFYGQRLRLVVAVTLLLVASVSGWFLLRPDPVTEPVVAPVDTQAAVDAQYQQTGFAVTDLAQLLRVQQQLQERLEKLPGWQLTSVRFPQRAQNNQVSPSAEWQFKPQGGSRRNLTTALEQVELFSLPGIQQTLNDQRVTFVSTVEAASPEVQGKPSLGALALSQQVNWLLDELPVWFSDMQVQPGEVRQHAYNLLSQVVSLDFHKLYPEDLQNLVHLTSFLQVRLLTIEYRYQQPYWQGQVRLELFDAQGGGDD